MKSSVVKVAVAAAIIVAVVAGIILWTGTRSGMVLADVLSKMEQIQAFSYKATLHVTDSGSGVPAAGTDVEMTMLVTNEYGMRMDMSSTDPNGSRTTTQQMYWLPQQKMAITVLPEMKMYTRIELDDSMFEEMRKENNDPRVMVRQILDCQYEKLGRSVMDGVEVEGFRTTDPAYVGGGLKDGNVTIWVDVKRGLPVRMEMKMKGSEQMEMGVEGTLHDFQWDVPVSAAEFTPTIPADFRAGPGDGIRLPPMTEETAVAGLKLCQELTGKYPDDLNLTTLTRVMREKFEREQTFATPPEPPQLPDLKTSLGKDSRLTMPPQRPGPAASREEMEKWLEEMKQWRRRSPKKRRPWRKQTGGRTNGARRWRSGARIKGSCLRIPKS